jgi:hypothetical protein
MYIKCNIWWVAVRLSYIWDAGFLKVKLRYVLLPAVQVQFLIWTGDSGSNPERAHGDKFLVCQKPNLATQQEV